METEEVDDDATVRALLADAEDKFLHSIRTDPHELEDFQSAMRILKGIMAMRECRRKSPKAWDRQTPESHPETYGFKR